ncbi:YncE family protein [Peribacillus sp. TH24]|uniref:YncE family protein n=1 Tax=Peribacillus sp. TH24 TaxID=2798483 RepID=UPI00191241B3|nr:WD40 repeat domain-containing protein [Peribacillus sp. TH24]MBK5442111.1 WD40 repeat domain-containing protein [Peribacillus sp. TH24]
MKWGVALLFAVILLSGCNRSDTYTKINKDKSFLATVNIKDTSLTFIDKNYQPFANWDISEPFTGALLLADKDTILLYGKEMEKIQVFSLSAGKLIDSWEIGKGIVNMLLLHDGKSIVAVNQSNHSIYFFNDKGEEQDIVKVGKSPLTVLQGEKANRLYVINFGDTKCSVINLETKKVDMEFPIHSSSTGTLLREEKDEVWIGGHGVGDQVEENLYIYSAKTGELKQKLKAPTMPIKFIENAEGIFILSHGTSSLYKLNDQYEEVKSRVVGVNPFEMANFKQDVIVAGYDSDEVYVMDAETVEVKKTIKVGQGPFQLMLRE